MEWSETPAYKQVAELLRQKIKDEGLKAGDPLPSISTLMKEHDVSITVIRMALKILQGEGLVRSSAGKGNFVGDGRPESGTPEFEQIMRRLGEMSERLDDLTRRLEQVEGRPASPPASAGGPSRPSARRGRQ